MSKTAEEEDLEVVVKRKPGGLICRVEPNNTEWIMKFPRSTKLMKKDRWFTLCEKLQGYHSQVTMSFIKNYKDEKVHLESLTVRVNEDSIAEVIDVPAHRERWFK